MVLGLTLARKWRLSKQILCGMGAQLEELPPDVLLVGEKLRRVCEAGEALARASDPEHYPTARMDWDLAQHEIHQMIGPEGLAQIFVNIERRCQAYKRFCPELQPDRLVHEVHAQIGYSFGRACYERNPHIPKCPQFLREQLGELYSKLDGFSVRSELIQILIQQSALAVGFKRGAVFMLEPESRVLSPRLVFGDFRMFQHRPRNLRLSHDNESPIVEAFNSGSILMAGGSVLFVAGTLGNLERLGVLYMEIPREVQQARGATAIDCFCAINQALSDCLTIQ